MDIANAALEAASRNMESAITATSLSQELAALVPWAREALTLLFVGLNRKSSAPLASAPGSASSPAPAAPGSDTLEFRASSNRAKGLEIATSLKSWLEDVGPLITVLRRVKQNDTGASSSSAGAPNPASNLRAKLGTEPSSESPAPAAVARAVRHMTQRLRVLQHEYAVLTGQTVESATACVSEVAVARTKAEAVAEKQGWLQEAALWSSSVAQRALRSVVATLSAAIAASPGAAGPSAPPRSAPSPPPGHTRFSWGIASSAPPSLRVPSGHTRFSWGIATPLDGVADQLCELCLRHRALMAGAPFREALQDDVAGLRAALRERRRTAPSPTSTLASAAAGCSAPASTESGTAASSACRALPSVGNFAFGLSPLPSVWAVLAHPAVSKSLAAAHAGGPARCMVLGSSTGVIPLALAAATALPCDGVELLPSLHRLACAEQRRVSYACRALVGGCAVHPTSAFSEGPGPSTAQRVRALGQGVLLLGDATDTDAQWPGGATGGGTASPHRLVWLTALCWDDAVREAALRSVLSRCGPGTIVVDYSAPPRSLMGGGASGGPARELQGVARIRLPAGGATWAPAASGVRQHMWVSRVAEA